MTITLRPAVAADRSFVKAAYFESARPIFEELFGCEGAEEELAYFDTFYSEKDTQIIMVDDDEAGFMTLLKHRSYTEIQCIFLRPQYQNRGIGTQILRGIIAKADSDGTRLSIGTHKINPAKRLYERLGFVVARESHYRFDLVYPDPFTEGSPE